MIRLFHASEEPKLKIFEPRPVPSPDAGVEGEAVWAVDEAHLPNYLLPRDCPRVTFAASSGRERVIALEAGWFSRIKSCGLYLYEFSPESFELIDKGAGYYISRNPVEPFRVTKIEDLLAELLSRNIELRFLPNLWNLRDAIASSSLEFSIIRFRNAQPREL